MLNELTASLLLLESRHSTNCIVCGSKAQHKHHLIQKGIGGKGKKVPEGATVSLCFRCHEATHAHRLHFRNNDGVLQALRTEEPMKYIDVLDMEGWFDCD